ncbi:hypothetical protein R1X32_11470 (plasmid) [Rhodococcus opacus]|uniref:gluconate 2-dehydrogenase subunit 3 family protein n=1 Tax=Rhodococcus opacus TaxID=37919 RepID=UPI0034D1A16F
MTNLTDDDRTALGELADLLIPATATMPSATDVDVHTKWIDRAISARPELQKLIRPAIDAVKSGTADEALASLKAADEEALEVFLGTVSACYYMHPGVRKRIGYTGQNPVPIADGEAEYYLEGGLLDPVIERGPIYRNAG